MRQLPAYIKCNDYAAESRLRISSSTASLHHSPDAVLYRIWNGLVDIPAITFLQLVPVCTRGRETRYMQMWYSSSMYGQTFFPCAIRRWNSAHWGLPTVTWQFQRPVVWHRACVTRHPVFILRNIRVMVIVWRLRGNIIGTALCWIVWHDVHSPQHTYMSSSYRCNRLGLSHWDPYTVHCIEAVAVA